MSEAMKTGKAKEVVVESELLDAETIGEYRSPEDRGYDLHNLPIKK
jgi:hypothetical protein